MMQSRSKSGSFDPENGDKEAKRQAELRQKHIQLVDNLHLLKAQYQEEYMDGLTEKIKKQRRDIKKKTEEFNKSLQEQERIRKEEARHWLMKRNSRPSLHHDNSFLENLETNKLHKICAIESKLLRDGQFRTVEDRDKFWEGHISEGDSTSPHAIPSRLSGEGDSGKMALSDCGGSVVSEEDHSTGVEPPAAVLGLIREETELSGLAPGSRRRLRSIPSQRQNSTMSRGLQKKHPKVAAFEAKFKQVEFPSLSAFTLDLEAERGDAADRRLGKGYQQRARLRRHHSQQLNRMYELSLAHLAAAQRMLDNHEDPLAEFGGLGLSDVLSDNPELPTTNVRPLDGSPHLHPSPPPTETDVNNNVSYLEKNQTEASDTSDSLSSQMEQATSFSGEHSGCDERPTIISRLPLTLDAVMDNSPVKEANRSGVLWYNYGKFLPSIQT